MRMYNFMERIWKYKHALAQRGKNKFYYCPALFLFKINIVQVKFHILIRFTPLNAEIYWVLVAFTIYYISINVMLCLKLEEQDEGDSPVFNGIREYLCVYKNFSENLAMVLKLVLMEDMTKEGMTETDSMIETLLMQVPQ